MLFNSNMKIKDKINRSIEKTRSWLEKNKVFFEVFSFFFLGIASIIVSCFSLSNGNRQLELQNIEQSPILHFKKDNFYSVYNLGKHLFELDVKQESYFVVDYINDSVKNHSENYYFKLSDFYKIDIFKANTTGKVLKIKSSTYLVNELDRINKIFRAEIGKSIKHYEFEHFFILGYKNIKGDKLNKYYLIDDISVTEITKSIYEDKQRRYKLSTSEKVWKLNQIDYSNISKEIKTIYKKLLIMSDIFEGPA